MLTPVSQVNLWLTRTRKQLASWPVEQWNSRAMVSDVPTSVRDRQQQQIISDNVADFKSATVLSPVTVSVTVSTKYVSPCEQSMKSTANSWAVFTYFLFHQRIKITSLEQKPKLNVHTPTFGTQTGAQLAKLTDVQCRSARHGCSGSYGMIHSRTRESRQAIGWQVALNESHERANHEKQKQKKHP